MLQRNIHLEILLKAGNLRWQINYECPTVVIPYGFFNHATLPPYLTSRGQPATATPDDDREPPVGASAPTPSRGVPAMRDAAGRLPLA